MCVYVLELVGGGFFALLIIILYACVTSMMCPLELWSRRWTAWCRSVWALWAWTSTSALRLWWGTQQKKHTCIHGLTIKSMSAREHFPRTCTHTHKHREMEMKYRRPDRWHTFPQQSQHGKLRSRRCMHAHIRTQRSASSLLRLMLHTLTSPTGGTGINTGD